MRKSYKIFISIALLIITFSISIFFYGFRPKEINPPQNFLEVYNVPIIMYHSTYKKSPGKYNVPPALLESDLIFLKDNGYTTIFMQDLINFTEKKKLLPDKPIIITFDDGYTNNYLYAYPLFKKYEMKCVMSVVGKYTDDNYKNGELCPTRSHVTYEEISEMHKSGLVEIQNHTYNLHKNSRRIGISKNKKENYEEYEKALSADLMLLQDKLKDKVNINCTTVAYPFGRYTKGATEQVLKKLGFKAGLTCNAGINKITKDSNLFYLKRFNRAYGKSSEKFFKCLEV